MQSPKVSVIMPVYNGEAYLIDAATSVLQQSFSDLELIIIDDGSTDQTSSILQNIAADQRVKVITNEENSGLTYTRNRGICNATGEYIAMLDSDDVALSHRLEKQVAFLDANPEFAMVGSSIDLISSDDRYIRTQHYPMPSACIPSLLLFQNNFAQSTVMIRKSSLPSECYRQEYPPAEDYDLWVRLAANHKLANINAPLVKYRIHSSSTSALKAAKQLESIEKIVSAQLQNIGVAPSSEELALHVQIGLLEVPKGKAAVRAAENWLLKLRDANLKAGYYPASVFNAVVALKWYEVCKSCGLRAYDKMLTSKLINLKYAPFILQYKFKGK